MADHNSLYHTLTTASSSAVMSAEPLAPRHPREDLHRFVNGLNVRYGIGIHIPDPALSPSKRKEQGSASTRLYTRLEVHFYHGGLEALLSLTKAFDGEIKDRWSKWVKKPKGDLGTLPRTGDVPLAANDAERQWLQSLFHQVLDRSQPTRSFGRTQSGPAAYSMDKTTHQSKRVADADMGGTPTKRPKPVEHNASAALTRVDEDSMTPKPASEQSWRSSARTADSPHKSFQSLKTETTMGSSLNTSKASFASVFSNQQPGPVTTTEASTEEQRRGPDRLSQETYPPTSAGKEALQSFDNGEISFSFSFSKNECQDHLLNNGQSSPAQTSNYSGPTSSTMAAFLRDSNVKIHCSLAGQRHYLRPSTAEPSQGPLHSQLHCVLRTVFVFFLVQSILHNLYKLTDHS